MIDRIQSNTGVCLFFHPVQDKNAALNFTLSVNFTFTRKALRALLHYCFNTYLGAGLWYWQDVLKERK